MIKSNIVIQTYAQAFSILQTNTGKTLSCCLTVVSWSAPNTSFTKGNRTNTLKYTWGACKQNLYNDLTHKNYSKCAVTPCQIMTSWSSCVDQLVPAWGHSLCLNSELKSGFLSYLCIVTDRCCVHALNFLFIYYFFTFPSINCSHWVVWNLCLWLQSRWLHFNKTLDDYH